MGNASGVSRGDRNRNARLARLRALVPTQSAIVGVDLADRKQAQTVIAAAILRHLPAVITTGTAWDPSIATHGTRHRQAAPIAA